ncbi:MAG: NAD(P)H-dependent oxidoreductase [Ferruginibacter sp.]
MFNVKIIISTTRPGRKGPVVASWIHELAKKRTEFNVELVDLAILNLPFLDEPKHPSLKDYQHQHTKDWSSLIDAADAFIIVTAEYNFGYPAPLKNALDYLFKEWNYKPVAFVSYGGISGGTRAVQQLKQVVTAQKMMPVTESVNIPFFTKHIDVDGNFITNDTLEGSAKNMFDELAKWSDALFNMRAKNK